MDWIKVLNRHVIFEYNDLSDSEFRAWIKIMAVAAFMEQMPTHEQMVKHIHHKTLTSLQDKLKTHSTTLHDVLKKVLIDAQGVVERKKYWKDKKKEYRAIKSNVHVDIQETSHVDIDKEKEIEKEKEIDIKKNTSKLEVSTCPHQEIISLYHEVLPELPPVKIWNAQRQTILRARWVESPERQCLEWWRGYFGKVRASPFLMGQEKDFRATLEWIIRPKNMPKVIEGFYDKRNNNNKRYAGIKAWLEHDDEEARQGEICQGDGSPVRDI